MKPIDLAQYVGGGTPWENAAEIQAADHAAAKAGVALTNSRPGPILVGHDPAAKIPTGGAPIISAQCPTWDLDGTILDVAPNQRSIPPLPWTAESIVTWNTVHLPMRVNVEANAHAAQQSSGYVSHGLRFWQCGPRTGTVKVRNVRGLTGLSSNSGPETFFVESYACDGGDDLVAIAAADDFATDANGKPAYGSGVVYHQMLRTSLPNRVQAVAYGTRHGLGVWGGGTLIVKRGTLLWECGIGLNIERGPAVTSAVLTEVSADGTPVMHIAARRAGTRGVVVNGTGGADFDWGVLIGVTDTIIDGTTDAIVLVGTAAAVTHLSRVQILAPTRSALDLGPADSHQAARASRLQLDHCTYHPSATSKPVVGGKLPAAAGQFTSV